MPRNIGTEKGRGKYHQKIIKTGFKKVFLIYHNFSIKSRKCLFKTRFRRVHYTLVKMIAIN